MKLQEIGEFGLIRRFTSRFSCSLPKGIEGVGDDCAVIPFSDTHSTLVTTDLLIENVHFLLSKITPQELGFKALAVNLSDIAAMGGIPLYAFLSIGIPPQTEVEWLDAFFEGFYTLAKQEGVFLLGGDTASSPQGLIINVVVQGTLETRWIKRRSAAQVGDIICCTGFLGDSGGGLKALLDNLPLNETIRTLIERHHRPTPPLKEGQWLAKQEGVHAMMDISDGLHSDLRHILNSSNCGAKIDIDTLPLSSELRAAAEIFGWNAAEMAVCSGEDYGLLVTIDPQLYPSLNRRYQMEMGKPLYAIGVIQTSSGQLNYYYNQCPISIRGQGFNHFI